MNKRLFVILLSIIITFLLVLFLPFRTALIFYQENTDELEAYLPIRKGDTFQIIFKHSIHLTDVVEKYEIMADGQIKEYEFIFEQFGIGMPSNANEGEEFVYENGKYHIRNMDHRFPLLKVRNGKTVSEHRLVWGDKEEHMVWFNDYFKPGAWFTIKVEKLTLWQSLKGVRIHD